MVMEDVELLRAACCIAGADGEISARERETLENMAERVGVGTASLRAMMDLAKTDKRFHSDQLEMVHSDPERSFETLYRVARLEREVPAEERELLVRFGRKLGLRSEGMNEIIRRVHGK